MSRVFDWINILASVPGWVSPVNYISLVLNFIGAALLMAALFPPFLDTKRSRRTYGVSSSFFLYYIMGGSFMFINAILNILQTINGSLDRGDKICMILLFSVFVCVNLTSFYLNTYILGVKRKNMREAAAKGMSEQDYWEKYLKTGAAA